MRVVLACNGEGFGHVARMVSFAKQIQDDYELLLFAPHTVQEFIKEHLPHLPLFGLPHLYLEKVGDRIDYWNSIFNNLPTLTRVHRDIGKLSRHFKKLEVQAVISDFEPYSGFAAKTLGLPVLQINHPGIILKSYSMSFQALSTKLVARFMMGFYDRRLFCSFYDGDIGLILRPEIANAIPTKGDHLVVYLKPSYREPVLKKLEKMGVTNIEVFPDPEKDFVASMASSRAVITMAGHQTLSEAMYLGKPILALPQRMQFEQRLNGIMLENAGWGISSSVRQLKRSLPRFIEELDSFPKNPRINPARINLNDETKRAADKLRYFLNHLDHYKDPFSQLFENFDRQVRKRIPVRAPRR